jgi:hypothetical protein
MMGTYAPGQDVMFPFTPVVDRNLIFSTVAISPEGVRSIRELADAHEVGLVYTRAAASEQLTSMASDALTVPTGIRYPK